ncbi:hypothetical protein [Paenimyroides aestuarii]|uniref:Uncharacterized protein n=1 Tax=Paenimyroides aestuarii TaxID=2968490 RepID=A0ABY5NPD6_9FLAO|nr:hypothetical protein [Paenimyroides aestuarii]UUV20415.1 hypothetical protein NPX36_08545 [Paenimyroides aestuarii]
MAFLWLFLCFISCNKKPISVVNFDELIHYKVDSLAANKKELTAILSGEAIETIADTLVINQFTELGFVRSLVDKSSHKKVKQVLTSNQNTTDNSKCMPIYRDFLILKKQNKTVGIFKVCLECSQFNYIDAFTHEERLMNDENSLILKKLLE